MRRLIGKERIYALIVINLVLVAALGLTAPHFLTKANLIVMVDNLAMEAIILSGYALLLICGNFDLSVDGIVALSGVVAGLLMAEMGVAWPWACAAAIGVALLVGLWNAIIVIYLKINGLIATLTSWWICVGLSLGLTKALSPYGFPEAFQMIGQTRIFGFRAIVVYAIIIFAIITFVLHFRPTGMYIYATGGSRQNSEFVGVKVDSLSTSLYLLVAGLSGLVGLLIASRLNAASPVAVDGMAMRIIAAIVIGGGNLNGGEGTTIGGLLGLVTMHILNNAIIQFGISPYYQKALLGAVLLTAVLVDKPQFSLRGAVKRT
jgi:ribose transport system permease protein